MTTTNRPLSSSLVALALVATISALPASAGTMALAPGDKAPELRGYTFVDRAREIVDYSAGKLTLINFWATWCEPCKDEMAALAALYKIRADAGLQVVGVLQDNAEDVAARAFVEELGVTYPVMRPQKRYLHAWGGIASLPTSFLIDGQGRILRRYVGAAPEQIEGLLADLEASLHGRPLGPYVFASEGVVTEEDRQRKLSEEREAKTP